MKWYWVLLLLLCGAAQAAPVGFGLPLSPAAEGDPAAARAEMVRMKAAGVQYVRIRTNWPRLQPAAVTWNFAPLDALVREADAAGLEPVLVLGPAPGWTVTYLKKPTAAELRRAYPTLTAVRAYAGAVARHYRGRVRYYQLWERPSSTTLLANPCTVQALFRGMAAAIHAVDSDLQVIAPEPGDLNLSWVRGLLANAKEVERPDILLLAPDRHASSPRSFWFRAGVLRDHLSVPATWAEAPLHGDVTMATAALMGQSDVIMFKPANDVLPAADSVDYAGLTALTGLSGMRHAGWAQLASAPASLFNAGTESRWLTLPEPLQAGTPVLLPEVDATAQPGIPDARPAPVAGDTVTLDADGQNPAALRTLRDMPAGRYSLQRLTAGTALCTDRDRAPWIYFDVPDGFLFFNVERRPVEIAVTVMGANQPEKAGFNLYYDAFTGMRYSAWQKIDVGPTKTFTYTFRLNDTLFSDQDGYDFLINAGGSVESVRVLDVSVRKL
ncbi:MAG: glycoside hydrolase 5 family protein [Armatimonadota bacterium]